MELQLLIPKRSRQGVNTTAQSSLPTEDCKLFKARGSCPFGSSCKYRHTKVKTPYEQVSEPKGPKKPVTGRSTALNYKAWEEELPQDHQHREFLLSGIKNGFHIVDPDNIKEFVEMDNYRSATDQSVRAQVESQILTEIENGRYRIVSDKSHIVSALGAIPKKNSCKMR